MNYEIILSNIHEAQEQLEEIAKQLQDEKLSESEYQIKLEHVYHHLNLAWNIRQVKTKNYQELSDKNFNKWSEFPKEIKPYKV